MSYMNRLNVAHNRYQGETKTVLTVCSAGVLRSPTAAHILSAAPYNFNTRSAGLTEEYALIYVDEILLEWAQAIVCMEKGQEKELLKRLETLGLTHKPVYCLEVPDQFPYRDPKLVELLDAKLMQVFGEEISS
jgi:predicted protein tyrosine phosphatase